jgi:hypothetical protein
LGQIEAQIVIMVSPLISMIVFLPYGKLIDRWKNAGFPYIRFRLIGLLLGVALGIFLGIRNPGHLAIWAILPGMIGSIIILGLVCLLAGWALDYLIFRRASFLRSIYKIEFVFWVLIGVLISILFSLIPREALQGLASPNVEIMQIVIVGPLAVAFSLYICYLLYLFLWKLRSPWNVIALIFFGGLFCSRILDPGHWRYGQEAGSFILSGR